MPNTDTTMSDTYQAVYDAVRSRISGCDTGNAIEGVARELLDVSHLKENVSETIRWVSSEFTRPSVMFRPNISKDGSAWIACLGDNLQVGVVGTGDTPDEAMRDFDRAWAKN